MFKGSFVALITPFKNGAVDKSAFKSFVDWQIAEGTDGLVPVGTTGESPTLSHDEHDEVIELCIEANNGRVPVVAGTGSNSTAEAIRLTKHAKQAGADAALIVTPYYNKPTQEGLYRHYAAIADAVDIPIIVYNIPGRSVVDMTVETMARLSKIANIVGVKDASADPMRPMKTAMQIGPEFAQLSGEDGTIVPFLAGGGDGCISVTANVAPRACAELHDAWQARDLDTVMEIQKRLMPLHIAMFCEASPGPVKYAASLLGKCDPDTRLPLCEIAESSKAQVRDAMQSAGLLN
ncbi:4-hydroxy-tetrahydrodipicolinate synthase [Thalassospiraceae bacterium LMO-JJ14]|nr:4-hydroxy-tetrahydrodipicolinate synthase [Thalassospiraceae bacterium LMO-JJ14]